MPIPFTNVAAISWPGDTSSYAPDDDQYPGSTPNLLLGGTPSEATLASLLLGDGSPDSSSDTGGLNPPDGYGGPWNDPGPPPPPYWNGASTSYAPTYGGSVGWIGATASTPWANNTGAPSQVDDSSQRTSSEGSNAFPQYPTASDDVEPASLDAGEIDDEYTNFDSSAPIGSNYYHLLNSGDSPAVLQNVAYVVKREHPRLTRNRWQGATGRQWPKDPATGRNQDVSHKQALADGGTNEPDNVEPQPHDEHVQDHMENGDFKRWGARSGQNRPSSATPRTPQSSGSLQEPEAPPPQSEPRSAPQGAPPSGQGANPSAGQHPPPTIHGLLPFMRLTPWGVFWSTLLQADPAY